MPRVAHGCIIARVQLFINDVELPGVEPPVQQVLQIMQVSYSCVCVCVCVCVSRLNQMYNNSVSVNK